MGRGCSGTGSGHHSIQTTEIYLHTEMERKRAAVDSL